MDKYTLFENKIEEYGYINNPYDLIYEEFEDANEYDIVECLRIILVHNHHVTMNIEVENEKLKSIINAATAPVEEETVEQTNEHVDNSVSYKQDISDLSHIESLLDFINDTEQFEKIIEALSKTQIARVKLMIIKRMNLVEQEIVRIVSTSVLTDVADKQLYLMYLHDLLEITKRERKIVSQEEIIDESEEELSKIIIVPNAKNSTYVYDDISSYESRTNEIRIAMDKVISGYFLKSKKDLKTIKGHDNLHEYVNPNGIRILYSLLPNGKIAINMLFFKDKKKSNEISGYYDEAERRFQRSLPYILENIENPNFYIEQSEQIGEIYNLLDPGINLTLKPEE